MRIVLKQDYETDWGSRGSSRVHVVIPLSVVLGGLGSVWWVLDLPLPMEVVIGHKDVSKFLQTVQQLQHLVVGLSKQLKSWAVHHSFAIGGRRYMISLVQLLKNSQIFSYR